MKRLLLLIAGLIFFSVPGHAEPLTYGSYVPGYPPFVYWSEEEDIITGVFPDLHRAFAQQLDRSAEFLMKSRQYAENGLYSGLTDMMALSPKWAQRPEQLAFSQDVVPSNDFLYSINPTPFTDLHKPRVCVRQHYRYPSLEAAFADNKMERLEVSSQHAQFRLLMENRCDAAMMNRAVTRWYRLHVFPDSRLIEHDLYFAPDSYAFAFPKSKAALRDQFNAFLDQYRASGQLDRLIERHLNQAVPHHNASTVRSSHH